MAHKPQDGPLNPLKTQNESKETVKERSDQALAGPARNTVLGDADEQRRRESREHSDQGATSRDAAIGPWANWRQEEATHDSPSPGAASNHPGEHGGVRATDVQTGTRGDGDSGVKHGPSPADQPSSERTGTAPHRGAASGRSGRTDEDRHRPRG